MGKPALIAINHDDYHAEHVGRTADGRQFFLTSAFEPPSGLDEGNEFVALYLFDADGTFSEARIDEFGPRATMDNARRTALYKQRLRELGEVTFTRIEVAPFEHEAFGTVFGLIARPGDEEDDPWWVELHPGNCMAFSEPWDSGEYDT
ncbi:hypothetical protein ABZ319_00395 [Nocardia sp. NPDC005978]|uniref:hypothetical protein n=1 Tax=Nocardia sp. NPDC005978 TaxID=3156725 RepID=UPI0033AD6070